MAFDWPNEYRFIMNRTVRDRPVTDDRLAAVVVAFAMAMDRHNPGFLKAFEDESERLLCIIDDEIREDSRGGRPNDGMPYLKQLFMAVERSKLERRYDTYV